MSAARYACSLLTLLFFAASRATCALGEDLSWPEKLPGTQMLDWESGSQEAMGDRLMEGAHRFVERKILQAATERSRYWHHDLTGGIDTYETSIAENRDRFQRLIGAADLRLPVVMQWFADNSPSALVAEDDRFRIYQVRWPVLAGVWGEGLLVQPRSKPTGYAVVLPDADQTPEQTLGLAAGIAGESQIARRLAASGFAVVVPALISRAALAPPSMDIPSDALARLEKTDQSYREWLYRQAYHMGRHPIGYEVQKVLAAVEWLHQQGGAGARVGVAGYGEGGLIAFHAAAVSTDINAVLVSGYFDDRQDAWSEPLYRNIWGQLREFGDAELATLVAPRGLVVEYSQPPECPGAKGSIVTPALQRVRAEFERIETMVPGAFQPRELVHGTGSAPMPPGSLAALTEFTRMLGGEVTRDVATDVLLQDRRLGFDPAARHLRQVHEIQSHVQQLVRRSDAQRDEFYLHKLMPRLVGMPWTTQREEPVLDPAPFVSGSQWYREYFRHEVIGRFDDALLPAQPRTRKVYDTPGWVGYDVVLDVHEDLSAWGVLLVPKDIKAQERRPVVVAQHGRAGLPKDLIDAGKPAYNDFAAQLVDRGFIVFVPHNLYRGEERYRWLDRKANTIKASLYSFIIAQHEQILRWLNTLDFVDGSRIGLYGLSFGGQTALRVPAALEGYAVAISSGFFNQYTRKVAGTENPFSFMHTIEWEAPYFNMGHSFDHAELGYLIFPRPFMVERGRHDRVAQDQWVAYEYEKVRRLYALFGSVNQTEITFFHGGHSIRGDETFDFLHRHLHWPAPTGDPSVGGE